MKNTKACMVCMVLLLLGSTSGFSQAVSPIGADKVAARQYHQEIPFSSISADKSLHFFKEGLLLVDMGSGEIARPLLDNAIEEDPEFAFAYATRAFTSRTPEEFRVDIEKAKSLRHKASEEERLLIDIYETYLTNDVVKRLGLSSELVKLSPNTARSWLVLGQVQEELNHQEKARNAYDKAIGLAPKWPVPYLARGTNYMFQEPKNLKLAKESMKKVVALASELPSAHINLGDAYRAENDLTKAGELYKNAIMMDPSLSVAHTKLGHVNSLLGKCEDARENYRKASELNDHGSGGVYYEGLSYLYQNNPSEALQFLQAQAEKIAGLSKSRENAYKMNLLWPAAWIALHQQKPADLNLVRSQMDPVLDQIGAELGTKEAKIEQEADKIFWHALSNVLEGKLSDATNLAEQMKVMLEPIQNPRKMERYNFVLGYVSMQQNDYAAAARHFKQSDQSDMYMKYMEAKAHEAAGDRHKAMRLYTEIQNYNFNNVGYALVRNEVAEKVAGGTAAMK